MFENIDEILVNQFCINLKLAAVSDYKLARFAFFNKLTSQFLWLALQAIEKYLKACAFIHNIKLNLKGEGHNLKEIFLQIRKEKSEFFEPIDIFPEFPSRIWPRPKKENFQAPPERETIEMFLSRLTDIGMNRYREESCLTWGYELIQLDAVIYMVQRYCHPIGAAIGHVGRPIESQIKEKLREGGYYIEGVLAEELKGTGPLSEFLKKDNFFIPILRKENIPKNYWAGNRLGFDSPMVRLLEECRRPGIKPPEMEKSIRTAVFILQRMFFPAKLKGKIKNDLRSLCEDYTKNRNVPEKIRGSLASLVQEILSL